jgi:hypothetical protein
MGPKQGFLTTMGPEWVNSRGLAATDRKEKYMGAVNRSHTEWQLDGMLFLRQKKQEWEVDKRFMGSKAHNDTLQKVRHIYENNRTIVRLFLIEPWFD